MCVCARAPYKAQAAHTCGFVSELLRSQRGARSMSVPLLSLCGKALGLCKSLLKNVGAAAAAAAAVCSGGEDKAGGGGGWKLAKVEEVVGVLPGVGRLGPLGTLCVCVRVRA